jgi:hypothetical protein
MTDEGRQSRAEHYREIAARLTQLARLTRQSEVKRELSELAERFERIAEHADKWEGAER